MATNLQSLHARYKKKPSVERRGTEEGGSSVSEGTDRNRWHEQGEGVRGKYCDV
jgi:hypothetical protein